MIINVATDEFNKYLVAINANCARCKTLLFNNSITTSDE